MPEFEFDLLSSLGLTPQLASRAMQAACDVEENVRLARVVEVNRDAVLLHDGVAAFRARPLPRLTRTLAEVPTALAVGDWVLHSIDAHGDAWIGARVPPTSHIVRRDGDGRRHPVVSNVDTALLVMGLDDDFNPRRIERYLALGRGCAVPVVVLTKARRRRRRQRTQLDARCACRAARPHTAGVSTVPRSMRRPHADAAAMAVLVGPGRQKRWCLLGSSGRRAGPRR